MSWRRHLTAGVLAVVATVEVPIEQFLEIRSLPDEAIRRRFSLPPSCEPAISAAGVHRKVVVTIQCVDDDVETADHSHEKPR